MSFNSLPLQNNQYGSFNYLMNGNFDRLDTFTAQVVGAQNWNAYKDAAGVLPVDGTGGTPTIINNAVVSTGTLRGIRSWTITKTGNAQGEGYSSDFTIDAADKSKVLNLSFDFSAGTAYTAGDLAVYVYDVTNAILITPTQTSIPATSGQFQAQFPASTSTSYRLIVHCAASNATTTNWSMELDNIRVTNNIFIPGTPVTDWATYALTIGATTTPPTKGTIAIDQALWRRVGDSAEIRYTFRQTAAGSAGSGVYLFPLPTGITLDTTKVTTNTSRTTSSTVGYAYLSSSSSGASDLTGTMTAYNSTNLAMNVIFSGANGMTVLDNTGGYALSNTTVVYSFFVSVPIAQWSSSANFVVNQTEYAFNTDTTDANNTSAFGYGPAGQAFTTTALTTARTKTVRFQNRIQPTDVIILEVSPDQKNWTAINGGTPVATNVQEYEVQNSTTYGVGLYTNTSSATDVLVRFGQYCLSSGTTYSSAGSAWSTNTGFWRVRKSSGPNSLQLSGAIIGVVDGSNALAGYVGEYLESKGTNGAIGTAAGNVTSYSLPPGDYDCYGQISFNASAGTPTLLQVSISTTSAVQGTAGDNSVLCALNGGGQGEASLYLRLSISVQTTVYLVAQVSASSHTGQGYKLCFRRAR